MMREPERKYSIRKDKYEKILKAYTSKINRVSNMRLLIFIIGISAAVYFYIARMFYLLGASALAAAVLFVMLIIKHQRLIDNKNLAAALYEINRKGLQRIQGKWTEFSDAGEEFIDTNHPYSYDLDIFGRGSLFQWINITSTHTGRQQLKEWLINPCKDKEQIINRQKAVSELSKKFGWRQRFMAEGMIVSGVSDDPCGLYDWAADRNDFYCSFWAKLGYRLLPSVTALLILLAAIGVLSYYIPVVMLIIQFFMIKYNSKKRSIQLEAVFKNKDDIRKYCGMFRAFERGAFASQYLGELKKSMMDEKNIPASVQIEKLFKIADSISNRYNAFYIIFDILTLWDYQCLISLECWKKKSGSHLKKWMETIGEVEALSSLAIIGYDQPEWAVPEIMDGSLTLNAAGLGHPLLVNNRVCNDLYVGRNQPILIITGSNMSGKSTLLRTAGINLILAYSGAPVCAKDFQCSIMDVYTCMRVSDNLEKRVSSFYAEILRIKMIVEACEKNDRVFFLLDEIFRGTNSIDRKTGAEVLITKLSKAHTLGLVSTHDLELGELEHKSAGKIKNYNFQEFYKDNKIFFDYKLREGVSTTRNAVYLMRMAGIEIEGSSGK